MSRDMKTIYGKRWSPKRGSGGSELGGGRMRAENTIGLYKRVDAHLHLESAHKQTVLSQSMEIHILRSLQEIENRFGTSVITPVIIECVAIYGVMQ